MNETKFVKCKECGNVTVAVKYPVNRFFKMEAHSSVTSPVPSGHCQGSYTRNFIDMRDVE